MIIYSKYNSSRKKEFQLITKIEKDNGKTFSSKNASDKKAEVFLLSFFEKYSFFQKNNFSINVVEPVKVNDKQINFEYIKGESLESLLFELFKQKDINKFIELLTEYFDLLNKNEIKYESLSNDFNKIFGNSNELKFDCLKIGCVDLNFDNIIFDSNKKQFWIIDYEWTFEFPIPYKYIIFRALTAFYGKYFCYNLNKNFIPLVELYNIFKISKKEKDIFINFEFNFQKYVASSWGVSLEQSIENYYNLELEYPASRFIDDKNLVILNNKNLNQEIQQKDKEIFSKDQEIESKDNIVKSKIKEVENKNDIIHLKEQIILQKVQETQLKNQEILQKVQEIESKEDIIQQKNQEIYSKINELSLIYSSRAWKVIVLIQKILSILIPVGSFRRKIAGYIYRFCKKIIKSVHKIKVLISCILRLIKKGIFLLKQEGLLIFIKKTIKFIIKKLNLNNPVIDLNYQPMFLGELKAEHITVVLHLYYTDMWFDISERLKNIPYEYTLIVSLTEDHYEQSIISEIYKFKPDTKILVFENKGMDILPFLKSMKYISETTKYLLKIHTKKSPHSPEIGNKWFDSLMDHVLLNKETVDLIFDNLENTNVGMIGGSNLFDIFRTFTGDEMYEPKIEQIYSYFKEDHSTYNWISGTMFWVKYDLISKLNDDKLISLIEKDQPSSYAQLGTIVHGIERYFGKLVYDAGKTISLVPEKIHHKNQIMFNERKYILSDPEESIIVISHDATKTGAPILALNIVKTLKEKFNKNVITVLIKGGPLEEEFRQYGIVFNLSHLSLNFINENDKEVVDSLFKDLAAIGVNECICNTVISGGLMPFLDKYKFSCINLIHEQSETIKNEGYTEATEKVLSYANKIVFSSNFVKNDFEKNFQKFEKEIIIRPQGIYLKNIFSNKKEEAHMLLREKLGLKNSSKIILGCGSAVLKKGVDLFFEIANQITSKNRELQCYFVWMGEWDELLKVKLLKMAKEKGFLDRIILIDFEKDPSIFFAGSDIFLLTSRIDPFPSVVLNAMDCGVPVIAFEKSGGSPEMLVNQQGLIVPYLDTKSMGKEVIRLLKNKEHYKIISENTKKAVKEKFIFEDYVKFLLNKL